MPQPHFSSLAFIFHQESNFLFTGPLWIHIVYAPFLSWMAVDWSILIWVSADYMSWSEIAVEFSKRALKKKSEATEAEIINQEHGSLITVQYDNLFSSSANMSLLKKIKY